ncbi:unnamed protein product [Cylicocyclus nassatus]|uniref:Cohesin loading complex subunit SCC4 homolog n=1 Tax=Cylicocyclus nassatus TaxID=53992 RepID=A0AA36H8E4_CYLNA|nr:unnamed protein product [Cylicocyclus nassatus]
MPAHVKFQLGKLYFFYTENLELAVQYLDSAYDMMTRMGEYFIQPRLEALVLICEALIHAKQLLISERVSASVSASYLGFRNRMPIEFWFWAWSIVQKMTGTLKEAEELGSTFAKVFLRLHSLPKLLAVREKYSSAKVLPVSQLYDSDIKILTQLSS